MKTVSSLLFLTVLVALPSIGRSQTLAKFRDRGAGTQSIPSVTPNLKAERPDAAKMISVLSGKKVTPGSVPNAPQIQIVVPSAATVMERKSRFAAGASPKGFSGQPMEIKRGRVPADGVPESPSSKTLYMKKGNTPAEGSATPPSSSIASPLKAGRVPAEGEPVPPRPRPSNPSGGTLLAGGMSISGGSGSYGAASPGFRPSLPAEISYRVDATSQLSTDTVRFVKGGIELADQASYDYLLTLSEALRSSELAPNRFVVEGHASAEGSDYANLVLSQRRANAIFDFLASRGVATERLLAVGHGESHARFAEHEPEFLRAQDRQVIVFKLAE